MLTWDNTPRKDAAGKVLMGYTTQLPHWGEASIHPHDQLPGEMVLDCAGLGIRMHPLGKLMAEDTLNPAERALIKALEQRGVWCLEALVAIGTPED